MNTNNFAIKFKRYAVLGISLLGLAAMGCGGGSGTLVGNATLQVGNGNTIPSLGTVGNVSRTLTALPSGTLNIYSIDGDLLDTQTVTSFASNVARMESIFYCAKKNKRSISLVGRSMNRIYKAAKQCGYLKDVIEPIDPREAKKISRDKIIFLCTGSQGEPLGAMNRIINDTHPDVYMESGDCVVFSSKIIPGNEKKLYALQNTIIKKDVEVITEENAFVHVSGHPNRDDLKDMYNWVKPKCVIPVHGEHRHMKEHISFAKEMKVPNTLQIENGDIVKLKAGETPKIIDKAPSGKMYLDGNIGVYMDSSSIKDRKNISINGYLEIILVVQNNGKVKKCFLSFKGIPESKKQESFIYEIEDYIMDTCQNYSLNSKNQERNLIDDLKQSCRKIIREKTGKKPYTNITIARL